MAQHVPEEIGVRTPEVGSKGRHHVIAHERKRSQRRCWEPIATVRSPDQNPVQAEANSLGRQGCLDGESGSAVRNPMQLPEAVRNRRSAAALTDTAPTDEQLYDYLALAAHSPDHLSLRAWRLVTVRGSDRERLGAATAAGFGDQPGTPQAARTAAKALRAPMLLSIVLSPVEHPKVPRWEQLAATAALVSTLELVLFDAGWSAKWRSGPAVEFAQVRQLLGIGDDEQLLGWLYIGGTAPAGPDPRSDARPDPDVSGRITPLP
jgi:nitroreductase